MGARWQYVAMRRSDDGGGLAGAAVCVEMNEWKIDYIPSL